MVDLGPLSLLTSFLKQGKLWADAALPNKQISIFRLGQRLRLRTGKDEDRLKKGPEQRLREVPAHLFGRYLNLRFSPYLYLFHPFPNPSST